MKKTLKLFLEYFKVFSNNKCNIINKLKNLLKNY